MSKPTLSPCSWRQRPLLLPSTRSSLPAARAANPLPMDLDTYIDTLGNGDSNDAEITGLSDALRAAYALLSPEARAQIDRELPDMLKTAQATRY